MGVGACGRVVDDVEFPTSYFHRKAVDGQSQMSFQSLQTHLIWHGS